MSSSTSSTFITVANTNTDDHLEGTVVEGVQGAEREPVDAVPTGANNTTDDLDSHLESDQDENSNPFVDPAPTTGSHSRRSHKALDTEATIVFNTSTFANESMIPTRPNTPLISENPGLHHALRREGAVIINASANCIEKV